MEPNSFSLSVLVGRGVSPGSPYYGEYLVRLLRPGRARVGGPGPLVRSEGYLGEAHAAPPAGKAEEGTDGYAAQLAKHIPGEIIAGWLALTTLAKGTPAASNGALWVLLGIFVLLTLGWVWRQYPNLPRGARAKTAAVDSVAFVIWVYTLGVPFSQLGWYLSFYGAAALVLYSLITPILADPRTPQAEPSGGLSAPTASP